MTKYRSKAYAFIHKITKRGKLDLRCYIGYLVGYNSTNIFRIWIPSKGKVIRTRDVRFDSNSSYNPLDLDIGIIIKEKAEELIETLELPEYYPL